VTRRGDGHNRKMRRRVPLDGRTWLIYSISVWDDIRKSAYEEKLKHPAMFPAVLPGRLIEVFTFPGDLVIDPFVGIGSTVVAAIERNRRAVGIDISPEYIEEARERVRHAQQDLFEPAKAQAAELYVDTAENLLKYVKPGSAALCVTSPPYWDILSQKRTADYKETRDYGEHELDLAKIRDYSKFLKALEKIFSKVKDALRPDGHCCIVVMDLRKKNRFYPFHSDIARFMVEGLGFSLEDIIIWNRAREYNNLRPLGHPYVFRVNKVHEYIMIFRKVKG